MRNRILKVAACAALLAPFVSSAAMAAPILLDFVDGDGVDNFGVGGTKSGTDGTATVVLTTTDVQAPEFSGTTATGNQTSAAGRAGFVAAANQTSTVAAVSTTQLGINNLTISDANGTTAGIGSAEAGNFNQNEAWLFRFDAALAFTQLNLTSVDAADQITVTIGSLGTFTLVDGQTNDDYNDPFNGLLIPANTEITFKNTSSATNSIVRIDSFTVAVPEPATLGAAGVVALAAMRRRRVRPR